MEETHTPQQWGERDPEPRGRTSLGLGRATEIGGKMTLRRPRYHVVPSLVAGMRGTPVCEFLSSLLILSLSTCHILFALFVFLIV